MSGYGGQLYEWNTDMDIDDKSIPYEQETWGDLSASERFLKAFSDLARSRMFLRSSRGAYFSQNAGSGFCDMSHYAKYVFVFV